MKKLTATLTLSLSILANIPIFAMENIEQVLPDQTQNLSNSVIQNITNQQEETSKKNNKKQKLTPSGWSRHFAFYSTDIVDTMLENNFISNEDKEDEYFWGYISHAAIQYQNEDLKKLDDLFTLLSFENLDLKNQPKFLKKLYTSIQKTTKDKINRLNAEIIQSAENYKQQEDIQAKTSTEHVNAIQEQINNLNSQKEALQASLDEEKHDNNQKLKKIANERINKLQEIYKQADFIKKSKTIKAITIVPLLKNLPEAERLDAGYNSDEDSIIYKQTDILDNAKKNPLYQQILSDLHVKIEQDKE